MSGFASLEARSFPVHAAAHIFHCPGRETLQLRMPSWCNFQKLGVRHSSTGGMALATPCKKLPVCECQSMGKRSIDAREAE